MSKILSTANNKPIPSAGKPIAFKITMIATMLADGMPAMPIDVTNANNTRLN